MMSESAIRRSILPYTLESRVARLLVVERYLRGAPTPETVGTPGVPRAWVDGSASARFVNVGKGA
jgi:hypothetical protein